jgi:transcriptional regulator with XRE-family HTH domain
MSSRTMNLRKQLRYLLELREMSAAQLARKASVPKQSISGWLAGSNPRDIRQIKRCADVLGTSVDNLLFGDGLDRKAEKVTELDALLGNEWISGIFEVRLRRVPGKKE